MIKQTMALFLAGISIGISSNAFADCPVDGTPVTGNFVSKTVDTMKDYLHGVDNHLGVIYDEGKTTAIVSGYAYHWRSQYTPEKLATLNEHAWGGGIAKTRINEHGNREEIGIAAFLDSHSQPELNAYYSWEKPFHLTKDLSVGVGGFAGLTSRADIAHHIPIPVALPEVSFGTDSTRVKCTVIPHLSKNMNSGAVTYCFASHQF
jgi:palmitoyl transferase